MQAPLVVFSVSVNFAISHAKSVMETECTNTIPLKLMVSNNARSMMQDTLPRLSTSRWIFKVYSASSSALTYSCTEWEADLYT